CETIYDSWAEDILDFSERPQECFRGIENPCMGESAADKFVCNDSSISLLIVERALASAALKDSVVIPIDSDSIDSVSTYSPVCANGNEVAWTGTVQVTSNSGLVVIYQTPSFTSVSFLKIESFSTSSVQFACVSHNGKFLEFSSVVGGIVAGRQISESQYNCEPFYVVLEAPNLNYTLDTNVTIEADTSTEPSILLIAEYVIVAAYILISYAAAIVAFRRRQLQKSMSDFKVFLNTSFTALFLVWASGNLAYMILFSALVEQSNFFYIKLILTLTYFFTYYGFALIIHYRRVAPYSMLVDSELFIVTSVVCFSYLSVTLIVEYCSDPGLKSGGLCDAVATSSALILSMYGVIADYVLGIIALYRFLLVPAVAKAMENLDQTDHLFRYGKRANRIFMGWSFLLFLVVILVFLQKLDPTVYSSIHASAIMNNLVQLLNTCQFWIAYELIRALEFLLRLATGRKIVDELSESDHPSSAKWSEGMDDLFSEGEMMINENTGDEVK
ncbi:MAG: hypothetical protein SGCHY_004834, partial [Lobulomycetales sp.]